MNGPSFAFFAVSALAALLGALFTVLATNPIRSAMALLLSIAGVTALFIGLDAHFLAAIELIVYAGAVVILFVFVIMLIGPDATPPHDSKALFSRTLAAVVFGMFALVTGFFMIRAGGRTHPLPPFRPEFGTIDSFGRELFTRGLVPFELTTALFVVAVVGALAVARGRHRSDAGGDGAKERAP
jgi:NADH-quinone oxidoreductase subunit J